MLESMRTMLGSMHTMLGSIHTMLGSMYTMLKGLDSNSNKQTLKCEWREKSGIKF